MPKFKRDESNIDIECLIYWGELKGILTRIKQEFTGVPLGDHLLQPLRQYLSYGDSRVHGLSLELVAEARALKHNIDNLDIHIIKNILDTVNNIQQSFSNKLAYRTGQCWKQFVHAQLAKEVARCLSISPSLINNS